MAFGDNAFGGSNNTSVGRRGRGNRGGMGGGGNNRNRRNRNRNNNNGGGGNQTPDPTTDPTSGGPFSAGTGDPFDSGLGSNLDTAFGGSGSVFDDPDSAGGESWRTNALGLLNQGGIYTDRAMGSQQGDWLEGQLADWYDQWQGQGAQAGDDAQTWLDAMYGLPGTAAPTGGVTQDWLQETWGPQMQQMLTARYQSQTPRQRGTQVSAWTGPRRIIQFLFAAASAATLVAEFATRAIGG